MTGIEQNSLLELKNAEIVLNYYHGFHACSY